MKLSLDTFLSDDHYKTQVERDGWGSDVGGKPPSLYIDQKKYCQVTYGCLSRAPRPRATGRGQLTATGAYKKLRLITNKLFMLRK